MTEDRRADEREQGHNTKDIIWYRCSCGKAFSNEREISKPDHHGDNSIVYYFDDGAVRYPLYGDPVARCWECLEVEITDYPSLGEWEREHLEDWERQGYERE